GPGLAVTDVGPGEVLELQGDVLGDVAGPRALAEPRDEAAAAAEAAGMVLEARQQLDERVREAGDLVARELLEHTEVDEHPDYRLAGPVVRAAQDPRLDGPERGLGALAVPAAVGRSAARLRGGGVARGHGRRHLPCAGSWCRLRHGPSCVC